jgi:hypothetical protein
MNIKKIKVGEEEFIRRTYMIRARDIDLIDREACWEGKEKKEIVDDALRQYFKNRKPKPYDKEQK